MATEYKDICRIYDASGRCVGHVRSNGEVCDREFDRHVIGRVFDDGKIGKRNFSGDSVVGGVSSDGKISKDHYGGPVVGCVNSDGTVSEDHRGGPVIGKIEGGNTSLYAAGGAGLLLLLQQQETEDEEGSGGVRYRYNDSDLAWYWKALLWVLLGIVRFFRWCNPCGKIMSLVGAASGIAALIVSEETNMILNVVFFYFVGGLVGTFIGYIYRIVSSHAKKGMIFGPIAGGVAGFILIIISGSHINIQMISGPVLFGIVAGAILGPIIGDIVRLIKGGK